MKFLVRFFKTKIHFKILKCSLVLEEWESGKRSVVGDDFNVNTVWDDLTFLLESVEIGSDEVGESELS